MISSKSFLIIVKFSKLGKKILLCNPVTKHSRDYFQKILKSWKLKRLSEAYTELFCAISMDYKSSRKNSFCSQMSIYEQLAQTARAAVTLPRCSPPGSAFCPNHPPLPFFFYLHRSFFPLQTGPHYTHIQTIFTAV